MREAERRDGTGAVAGPVAADRGPCVLRRDAEGQRAGGDERHHGCVGAADRQSRRLQDALGRTGAAGGGLPQGRGRQGCGVITASSLPRRREPISRRTEERRGGKEWVRTWRCRRSTDHEKKNKQRM